MLKIAFIAAFLALMTVTACSAAGVVASSRVNLNDPTARMLAMGFPEFIPASNTLEYLRVQFPHLSKNDTTSSAGIAELYRLETLILSLQERNTDADKKVLQIIRAGFTWCEVCTWVVNEILGKIESYGCSVAESGFAAVCAAIPYVDVVVDLCVEVLEWGCNKLAGYIANGVTDPNTLCNDVFDNICSSASGSGSSASGSA
jgi:hypothetical protein